jgi:hypothetical protein
MKHIVSFLTLALAMLVCSSVAQAGGLFHRHHRGQTHVQNNIIVGGTTAVVPGAAFAPVRSYGCCGGCCGGTAAAIVQQSYVPVQTQRTIVQQSYMPVQQQSFVPQQTFVPQQSYAPVQQQVQLAPALDYSASCAPAASFAPVASYAPVAGCSTGTCPVPGAAFSPGYAPVASTGHGVFRQRTVQRNRY